VQVALCMVLMIATGLLLRGLYTAYTIDPGFAYRDVALLSFGTDYGPGAVLNRDLMEKVAALPGIEAVAYAAQTPLGESSMAMRLRLPDQHESGGRVAEMDAVTPGYISRCSGFGLSAGAISPRRRAQMQSPTPGRVLSSSAKRQLAISGAKRTRSAGFC
jgi:hypothetical protein